MTKTTLSYGALLARFTLIKIELEKEKQLTMLLKQETAIQNYVIGQLKNPLSTQTKLSPCTQGPRTQNLRSGVKSEKSKSKAAVPPRNIDANLMKRLTRKLNLLQFKYGFPVASQTSD